MFVAHLFKKILSYNGIRVSGIYRDNNIDLNRLSLLINYRSQPLIDILRYNLYYSHNLTSEILLLHFANSSGCEYKNLRDASVCLREWYSQKFPGLNWDDLYWENGSGLSVETNIRVANILVVLQEMYKKTYGTDDGVSLLSIAGLNGTLKSRFLEESLHIWAKTGSMYFVSGLAGYLLSDNHRYAFVIIANDSDNRSRLDELAFQKNKKGYRDLVKSSKLWKKAVYEEQQDLINIWLMEEK